MNSRLDKTAYNDIRYGGGTFLRHPVGAMPRENDGEQKYQRPNRIKIFGQGGLFKLRSPAAVMIVLSMLYGGHDAATTHNGYSEVAHRAFDIAVSEMTLLWGQIAAGFGISDSFITSVVEFLAATVALLFAFFAGLGGFIVYVFQILFHI
jgi:hypothetical protein